MKSTILFTICALTSIYTQSMNISLMQHEADDQTSAPAEKNTPIVKQISQDMQTFQTALEALNGLQNRHDDPHSNRKEEYETLLKKIEQLATESSEPSVQRNAHFTLGSYAYSGYRPERQKTKRLGVDFKKALVHFAHVNNCSKLNPSKEYSQQQAEAYFLQGKIYATGESCFLGCIQTVKVDHEQAVACFTLAHEHAAANTTLQIYAAFEIAALERLKQDDE